MHTGLTAPTDVFHELPAAQALACSITAHLVDPSHLRPARAWRHDRHDRIDAARYTGWYADCYQYEILTGYVYAFEPDTDGLDDDDEAPTTYYAIVESDDTDLHYLSPDAYDAPLEAALAADRMAELIAELKRDCDVIRNQAAHAREQLAEGNRRRREAFTILRHVQACPIDGNALAPIFVRLYREAQAARPRHRPNAARTPGATAGSARRNCRTVTVRSGSVDLLRTGDHFDPLSSAIPPQAPPGAHRASGFPTRTGWVSSVPLHGTATPPPCRVCCRSPTA